jgi:hypothetical protein
MIPSSCDISRSERFYERLLRFYPERFRVEFGQQMMQAFQDQWRQEADRAALITKMSFWTQVLSDFVATVPLEHFRKGAFMDSAERDLRWDVRFGVQMFLRHSAMALKYALYSGLAVLTVWTIAILVVWAFSSFAARRMEHQVSNAWRAAIGRSPQEFYAFTLETHPRSERNKAAIELEGMAARLDIVSPGSDSMASQVRGNRGPFGQYDLPPYLDRQLAKPEDTIEAPSQEMLEYLKAHQTDLEALYNRTLENDPPIWDIDIKRGFGAPVPNLLFQRQVHGVIALDILEKRRQGRDGEALKAFEASWKIAESLRQRPELISQWISLLVMNRQAAVLRKMRSVPAEWQNRVSNASLMTTFSEATRLDAVSFAEGLAEWQLGGGGWADYFLDYPLSGPLRRLIGLQNLELTGQFLSKFGEQDPCRADPKSLILTVESSYSRWFFGENPALSNYPQAFREPVWTLLHLELTRQVLQTKSELQRLKQTSNRNQAKSAKSSVCGETLWVSQVSHDAATIRISAQNIPEWIVVDHRWPLRAPFEYSLQTTPLH